jgi:hypothetical protein
MILFFLIITILNRANDIKINAQAFTLKSHHPHQEVSYSHET